MNERPMRSRRVARCAGCGLPAALCLCAAIPSLATRTRLAIVAHHTEWSRSSNTGRLVMRAIAGTRVWLRGAHVAEAPPPLEGRRLVLFPDEGARVLDAADAGDDLVLVVPEGSWSQARRAMRREPWLRGAERVRLPEPRASSYRLRVAPHAGELSTLEAIARALGVLESEAIERALLGLLDAFVERSLSVRGRRSQATPEAIEAR